MESVTFESLYMQTRQKAMGEIVQKAHKKEGIDFSLQKKRVQ